MKVRSKIMAGQGAGCVLNISAPPACSPCCLSNMVLYAQVMLERAQAAPSRRRTGKPVMFRSMPPRKKEEVTVVDPAKEQERLDMKFLQ